MDPEGVGRRLRHRLQRRQYHAKGPNFIWHLDEYDKLKPYKLWVLRTRVYWRIFEANHVAWGWATTTKTYVWLATNFKERYRNHAVLLSTLEQKKWNGTLKIFWTLQDSNKPFQIKWKVLKKCKAYSNISKKCNLCLYEKFIIICKKELCSLNRRNELASSCPHRNRYVLQNSRVTELRHNPSVT